MRTGVRRAAPEHGHPADVRPATNLIRAQRIEPVTLDRLLARTAGYEIRRAYDAAGTVFAVKILRADAPPGFGAALEREHGLLERLEAPNVVAAAGLVEIGGLPALVLEHLGGGDLVSLRGFAARHWLTAARDAAAALEALHACGFAHRDVKARHVRFGARAADDAGGSDPWPRACLIDFGSAAAFGAPAGVGGTTAAHRRPGQRPDRVTAAEDVHAYAVLVYELMTGRLAFGRTPAASAPPPAPPAASGRLGALAALVMDVLNGEDIETMEPFRRMIDAVISEHYEAAEAGVE